MKKILIHGWFSMIAKTLSNAAEKEALIWGKKLSYVCLKSGPGLKLETTW